MINHFERYKNVKSNLIVGEENPDATPLVTIAIPTYKRPKYLKEAIDSALNQKDFHDYEVIVVDNDPDNEFHTEKLISTYPKGKIKYYRNEKNIGMFGNWNRCVELCKGKWVSLLHDDDYLYNNFLATWHKEKEKINSDYLMFSYDRDDKDNLVNSTGSMLFKTLKMPINKILRFNEINRRLKRVDFVLTFHSCCLGTVMNREKFISVGGYDENFYPGADWAFWIQSLNKDVSIYKHAKKVALYKTKVKGEVSKKLAFSVIDRHVNIVEFALGNKNNLITRTIANAIKECCAYNAFRLGHISQNELKQKTTNITKSFTVVYLFKIYYFVYKVFFFMSRNER